MRILVISPSLRRGGAERVVSILTKYWSKHHEVTVCLFNGKTLDYSHGGTLIDLSIPRAPNNFIRLMNALRRTHKLQRLFRQLDPDLTISFMETANVPSVLAWNLARRPGRLIVSVRNNPRKFWKASQLAMAYLYPFASLVVGNSRGICDSLSADLKIPRTKIKHIPNPVDLGEIDRLVQFPDPIPDNLLGKPFILGVGRLVQQKGFDLLIRGFAQLGTSKDVNLVILGEGADRPSLERLVEDSGLTSRVYLLGEVANPFTYFASAHVFVLSSRHEGWPNVLMEAMACRRPVVAFDCPFGPSEIIRNQVSGILVDRENLKKLAEAIADVLDNQQKRERLSAGSRSRAEEFDVGKIAEIWLQR